MSVPPLNNLEPSADSPSFRRFLTRAEAVTLVGMVLVIFSLFLPWERPTVMSPIPGSPIYINMAPRTGLGSSVRWPLILCAALCVLLLLWTPTDKTRLSLAVVQGACGMACLVITLTKLALLPGVLMGLIGSALLTFGAVDRFTYPPESPDTEVPPPPAGRQ